MTEKNTANSESEHTDSVKITFVGIGASAGGLEALRALAAALPTESDMTFIVAQHMDPKHPSLLRELISRSTPLAVADVSPDVIPQANTIYVTPPGHNIVVRGGKLQLEPVSHIGPKPSVDLFFSSLAEDVGERAIGIILSGTGSDGAHGVRAIKAAGGITISQDEQSAKYNGMPRSAIDTGLVDLVRDPVQIAQELTSLSQNPSIRGSIKSVTVAKTEMDRIFQLLLEQTECDFSNYKPSTLQRRIQRRMTVHRLESLKDYVSLLNQSPNEVEMLFKDILISVTEFFRDADAYQLLEKYIVEFVKNNKDNEPLRIWVTGCATGEEAYSIAMITDRALSKYGNHYGYQVFATDIDMDALAHARRGVYLPNTIRQVTDDLIERYFIVKDDTYTVSKRIRERVVFARQNLVRDPPFSKIDIISCRNVLIYFNNVLQKRVMSMFHYVMKKNGLLFLGKSESIGQTPNLFNAVDKKVRLFRKQNDANSVAYPVDFVSANPARQEKAGKSTLVNEVLTKTIDQRLDQVIIDQLQPPIVVVDEQNEIIHIRGDVKELLNFPKGAMDTNLLKLVRDDLRVDVRALLHKAKREGLIKSPRILVRSNDLPKLVSLTIFPLPQTTDTNTHLWALLFHTEPYDARQPQPDVEHDSELQNMRISELEQELMAMREHLQTTIEELETSNEELQSTNEELQSANEELQSTNEELETANEELQSTNEELSTVNQELQIKSTELASVNSDLENVLVSLPLPTLVVDNRLRVTRYSSAARGLFDIKHSDLGQIITSISTQLIMSDLRNHIYHVIEAGTQVRLKVKSNQQVIQLTITPYYSEHRRVVGAVLIFEERHSARDESEVSVEKNRVE